MTGVDHRPLAGPRPRTCQCGHRETEHADLRGHERARFPTRCQAPGFCSCHAFRPVPGRHRA